MTGEQAGAGGFVAGPLLHLPLDLQGMELELRWGLELEVLEQKRWLVARLGQRLSRGLRPGPPGRRLGPRLGPRPRWVKMGLA